MSKSNYNQNTIVSSEAHFGKALFGETQHSRMMPQPLHLTTFNAGELVPIYCREILPDEDVSLDLDFVIRQSTLLTPTMGEMEADFYAFFVPNRIVNQSWKAVEGENYNGSWTANAVSLAPLVAANVTGSVQIPVGSVADYYGLPTQSALPVSILKKCNDLRFRGYVMIWNEFFRDQNYQPPIPMSTLNVYQGFLDSSSVGVPLSDEGLTLISGTTPSDGSFGAGAISESLYGSGDLDSAFANPALPAASSVGRFRATQTPLRVNKLHDYFTSVLPSPQKASSSVMAPVIGSLNIPSQPVTTVDNFDLSGAHAVLRWRPASGAPVLGNTTSPLAVTSSQSANSYSSHVGLNATEVAGLALFPSNLSTTATRADVAGLSLSVDDIRMASAVQQLYETLARGGSRYREIIRSFFGLEVEDPFSDIPCYLGHFRRKLDLFQTAQTSASESGNTPQGHLAAFGYTSNAGHLFKRKFIEHGYLHVFVAVRQRNIYSSYMARDWFRQSMLDFYSPSLANISEQPVYTYQINPFASGADTSVFGYQEAWAEYRFEPDQVSGLMRPGLSQTLAVWNYADDFDSSLVIADGEWLRSNAATVLDRTLAVTSAEQPQLLGQFRFHVDKELPMPTYSVPGMDII